MSKNKQSSIDFLLKELEEIGVLNIKNCDWSDEVDVKKAIEQAKAMRRKEHGKTWDDSLDNLKARGMNEMRAYTDFDDYYNEKFGEQC